jgi:glycosyltransferase involved in cell wall biosynthesis
VTQFSILLATRDRPALFGQALASVLSQTLGDVEVVVVDDGSAAEHAHAYERVLAPARARLGTRLQHHRLLRRPSGHGQSYSLNVAAGHANGRYLAILDDDDVWTDDGHLARAARSIARVPDADLYMGHQRAFRGEEPVADELWLWQLAGRLRSGGAGEDGDEDGTQRATLDRLVALDGFCHLNCLIVRRGLWQAVGGMDEAIRWECDRDVYLRLIDAATGPMLHNPAVVSRHNIPDPTRAVNMTTALGPVAKRLQQLRVVDKAVLFARHAEVRAAGRRHRNWTLQKLTDELAAAGNHEAAAYFARMAVVDSLSPAFAAKAALYTAKAVTARRRARRA